MPRHTMNPRVLWALAAAAVLWRAGPSPAPAAPSTNQAPVLVDMFYEAGCPVCRRVSEEILPQLEARYGDLVRIRRHDTGVASNYLRLARLQERIGSRANASAFVAVEERRLFAGWQEIREGLLPCVEAAVVARLEEGADAAPARPPRGAAAAESDDALLRRRAAGFTVAGVIAGGLVDGINPCAISTLVFFLSMLSVLKVGGRRIMAVGATFCAASFIAYAALGFGLLRALKTFSGADWFRAALELAMMALLAIFAFLSFRDALRYRASGDARDVLLKLPRRNVLMIHDAIRRGLKGGGMFAGAFGAGLAVTALESVCTGQTYLPTLVLVLKTGGGGLREMSLLLLYNVMFIVPLVAALVLTARGMRIERLMAWSRSNVAVSKTLLGFFFLAMMVLIGAL